jgi:hypothetical protein
VIAHGHALEAHATAREDASDAHRERPVAEPAYRSVPVPEDLGQALFGALVAHAERPRDPRAKPERVRVSAIVEEVLRLTGQQIDVAEAADLLRAADLTVERVSGANWVTGLTQIVLARMRAGLWP